MAPRAPARRVGARDTDEIGNEGFEEPTSRRIGFLLLVFTADRAQLFADFYAEPDRVVPEDHP